MNHEYHSRFPIRQWFLYFWSKNFIRITITYKQRKIFSSVLIIWILQPILHQKWSFSLSFSSSWIMNIILNFQLDNGFFIFGLKTVYKRSLNGIRIAITYKQRKISSRVLKIWIFGPILNLKWYFSSVRIINIILDFPLDNGFCIIVLKTLYELP